MTNIKTFSVAGVSRQFGVLKIRMANDAAWRNAMLTKEGHVDIQLVELGGEMSKIDGIKYVSALTQDVDGVATPVFDAEAQAVFTEYLTTQGVIERPKKPRGRPAKVKDEAPAQTAVEGAQAALNGAMSEASDAVNAVVKEAMTHVAEAADALVHAAQDSTAVEQVQDTVGEAA